MIEWVLVVGLAAAVVGDLPVTDVFRGNASARPGWPGCVSWWGPQLIVTNSNTTLLSGSCKTNVKLNPAAGGGARWGYDPRPTIDVMTRSTDAGRTWSAPAPSPAGQAVYSRTTGTLFKLVGAKKKESRRGPVTDQAAASPCAVALRTLCGPVAGKGAACLACERAHAAQTKAAGCVNSKLTRFCASPIPPPPGPPAGLPGPVWAGELPPLTPVQLAKCEVAAIKSTDEGRTWSSPELLQINGSLGPHYAGGGLNHGIEIERGPHKGRLALARRFDCPAVMGDHGMQDYFHSMVLFSDDQGAHWNVGQLLPRGWTECQIAEMANGSLLMTSRMYGAPYLSSPGKASDLRRGFARSDDGGYTWAEIWYLEKRQRDIMVGTCAHALASNVAVSPTIYYGHPGNWTGGTELARANYTLHASHDGGGTWQLVDRVYGGGAGYSDANLLPDPQAPSGFTLAMAFQKTFDPPVPSIEGGGYNMGLALLPL